MVDPIKKTIDLKYVQLMIFGFHFFFYLFYISLQKKRN